MKLSYILLIITFICTIQYTYPEKPKGPILKPLKHDPHDKKPILAYLNIPQVQRPNRNLHHAL